jgi:biotin transport system substrate-specific component|tara:strand:- start:2871 stop:3485 length:615 start_codon:yes stop_codon:yes gene_type:complete
VVFYDGALIMSKTYFSYPTIADHLWQTEGSSRLFRGVILAFFGSVLLAISAKVQIPFWPVPMTMQTFVVLVIGMTYGWRLGGATLLLYLAEGAMGIPVFAKGGGLAYLAGPTAGYLFGFLASATLMGWLAQSGWDRGIIGTLGAMLLGTMTIFIFGVGWLSTFIGFEKAIAAGLVPFLMAEGFKIALAVVTLPLIWKQLDRQQD